ncbi:hypothetical protein AB0J48_25195 [Nocardia salmonicida]|uniref:hypothetical protein n=1 Tax=Nocardia TaxID=1817 RepID=UPI0026596018|nr:hypothetical protein [Nocardia sp. PE-7]WKG09907.1 hypothetical protein QX204_33865 [Nocardia sp. PE-7]
MGSSEVVRCGSQGLETPVDRIDAERLAEREARRRRAVTPAAKRLAEVPWPDRSWPTVRGLYVTVGAALYER